MFLFVCVSVVVDLFSSRDCCWGIAQKQTICFTANPSPTGINGDCDLSWTFCLWQESENYSRIHSTHYLNMPVFTFSSVFFLFSFALFHLFVCFLSYIIVVFLSRWVGGGVSSYWSGYTSELSNDVNERLPSGSGWSNVGKLASVDQSLINVDKERRFSTNVLAVKTCVDAVFVSQI